MAAKSKKNIHTSRGYRATRELKGVSFDIDSIRPFGAHAIGIGRKRVEGEETDKISLRFYIAKKRPLKDLSANEKVPKTFRFFSRKAQRNMVVTTDVIEAPVAQLEAVNPESQVRPAPGGVSCGASGQSGTLGGWVWDATDDTVVMLSNEHVLGSVPGLEILQPSVSDGGSSPADRIGTVKRSVLRSETEVNTVDCAIGDPDASTLFDAQTLEVGAAVYEIAVPALDLLVEKFGQSSRHTFGRITDADWSGEVGTRRFADCVRIAPVAPSADWSMGGDSGSLVFAQSTIAEDSDIKPAVGLHFAGSGTHGFACKIQNVFAQLSLDTLSAGAFTGFLDGLFEVETEGVISEETEGGLRSLAAAAFRPPLRCAIRPFVRPELEQRRAGSFYDGISRDLLARLETAKQGRLVTGFLDRHKPELFTMLVKEGDVRRATVAALRPLVAGATTTTDVLERILTDQDLGNLDKLARELERRSTGRLQESLKMLRDLKGKAEGKSLAAILGIEL